MRGLISIALLVSASCVTPRPAPRGLATSAESVATAERQVKDARKVREVAASLAGIVAGAGGVVLLGSQLQPIQASPGSTDPSLAGFQTASQRLQELALDNKSRDRTIAAGLLVGSLGGFLVACVASAVIDDGASEWLVAQREGEARELAVSERDANRALLEAALAAQNGPKETGGRTLRAGQKGARGPRVKPLPVVPGS